MASMRSHIRAQATWVAVMDIGALAVGSFIGASMRFPPEEKWFYILDHLQGWCLLAAGILLANYLAGSYKLQYTFSRFNLIVTWLFSVIMALMMLSVTSYAWFREEFVLGRGVLFLSIVAYSVIALFLKLLVYRSLFRSQILLCRTVVIGAGARAEELRRVLENEFVLPAHKVVACLRISGFDSNVEVPEGLSEVAIIDCKPGDAERVIRSLGVNLIVLGLNEMEKAVNLYPKLRKLRFDGMEVLSPLSVAEIYSGKTPLALITEDLMMSASMESKLPMVRRLKRLVDIFTAVVFLILLLPVMALIALLIKLTDPWSPVFYLQQRAGRFGKPFMMIKFRTMRHGAEKETGPVWSKVGDTRITPIGRVLRKFRLDEIPQFVNILKGEMSLVGPRPERPELAHELEKLIPFYMEREHMMPGLTGWAQIRCPYGDSVEDAARKLEYDLYYMKHLSFSLDLQIILSTLRIVLLGMERAP